VRHRAFQRYTSERKRNKMENEGQLATISIRRLFAVKRVNVNHYIHLSIVPTEAVAFFKKCMVDDPGMSTAVAAIQTLLEFMNQNAGKLVVLKRREHPSPADQSLRRNCPLHI